MDVDMDLGIDSVEDEVTLHSSVVGHFKLWSALVWLSTNCVNTATC